MSGKPIHYGRHRLAFLACWATLAALGLVVWSVLDPHPVPIVVAMTVGQAIALLALGMLLVAIFLDLRRHRVLDERDDVKAPSNADS